MIWVATTFILALMLLILTFWLVYYKRNIRCITKQLKDLSAMPDTNQLVTIIARQKDICALSNQLNNLLSQTRQSRNQINRLNRSFRESITNISHDLRTPLTSANGYIQILQDSANEEQQEYLRIVLERQKLVQRLLNQLFEYVRIESGEIQYEMRPVDVKNIVTDTLLLFYDDFSKRDAQPHISLPESPCMILGDEQGLKRTFSNIIFNAITHGQNGFQFSLTEKNGYVLTFSNPSEVLTKEDLDKVFERFYTKDKSRNRKTTGLGLSIAKEIIKQMGGKIQADYDSGYFSIIIWLPKI